MFTPALSLVTMAIVVATSLQFGFLFKISHEDLNTGKIVAGCTAFKIGDNKFVTARHCVYSRFLVTNSLEVLIPKKIHISASTADNSDTDWALVETTEPSKYPSIPVTSHINLDAETLLVGFENAETLHITNLEGMFRENNSWVAYGYSYYGMSGSPILQNNHAVGVFSSFSPDENMAFGRIFTESLLTLSQ